MPIFERPPLDTLAPAKDRWTPIYLEYGCLEVDDASIKWIGSDGLVTRLPVATVSALILGPGTSITHAAVKAAWVMQLPAVLARRGWATILHLWYHTKSPPAWGWPGRGDPRECGEND